ncbi:MAG: tRNA (adenosine(37)-N6)-dimethylallyltransferase MiaA [Wujia sp.]
MEKTKKQVIILTGPTAVGKTELSLRLARELQGEIISADSIQVYKHLDVGSAKIRPEEMQGIRHHLIDILEPTEPFHVLDFQTRAKAAMEEIYERGHIPIVAGGTGFYIQALLYDIHFSEEESDGYREELEALAEEKGNAYLHEMLCEADPESAQAIHENNRQRVIRALEYYHQTGKKFSAHNEAERLRESPYEFAYFVLTKNRQTLYRDIEKRIDLMMDAGLIEEVQNLIDTYHVTQDCTSMQGIGYKEIYEYLTKQCSLDEAIYNLKLHTRHFAKRQLTWFRREKDVIWLDKDLLNTEDALMQEIYRHLAERFGGRYANS